MVLTGARVTKILLSKPGNDTLVCARGASFVTSDGSSYTVSAKKEVILSAGSIQTPQLLELSGIGNKTILQKYGITTLIDLPNVGENLQVCHESYPVEISFIDWQDHPGIVANFQTLNNLTTDDNLTNPQFAAQQFQRTCNATLCRKPDSDFPLEYVDNRTGFYSSTPSTLTFLSLSQFVENDTLSQLKEELDAALAADPIFSSKAFKLERSWIDEVTVPHVEIVLFPSKLTIESKDPFLM